MNAKNLIIRAKEENSILYTIKNLSGKIKYYEGRFPERKFDNIERVILKI